MDPKTGIYIQIYIYVHLLDELLHESLFQYSEGKTLIVITHRLERIHMYDKVIVMENGEIIEEGNYEELSQAPDGFFSQFADKI